MLRTVAVCAAGFVAALAPLGAQPADSTAGSGAAEVRAVLDRYCITCHNDRLRTAGLTLDTLDAGRVGEHAETWEKVVRKLHARAMPPAGRPRPDEAAYDATAGALETALDRHAAAHPNPGRTPPHRLNRAEYANAIRDLLGLEVDGRALLPPDDADLGFDNMADILSMSPALLERYLAAARRISRQALGDPDLQPAAATYVIPKLRFQDHRMSEDLPFGSRGGLAVRHHFPLDAEYDIRIRLQRQLYGYVRGLQQPQQIELRLDGRRVALFTVGGAPGTPPPQTFTGTVLGDREWEEYTLHADAGLNVRIPVTAGTRVVGAAFVQGRSERDGVRQPRATAKTLAIAERWSSPSEAPEAAVEQVRIAGPFHAAGSGETPVRQRILTCRPARLAEEGPCAREILSRLARRAWRRPLTPGDADALMAFYAAGRREGGFEAGIRRGLESVLVDPEFLFRIERDPPAAAPISDVELASRLSFFLWSSIPDDALLETAASGQLRQPAVLEQQVRRMLADPRAQALVDGFALQWLGLRRLQSVVPAPDLFPEFDDNLREAFEQETRLFVGEQLRADRSVLDLLRADYTWVDERLARHYGIPDVYGSRFRKVTFEDGRRGGLLGQGSILTVTSYPTRTSPVLRGNWLLEHLLGAPPPPPPPDVPALPDQGADGRLASVRERLEAHRENPVCASCHARMDPLGFALEHFDPIGQWRATGEAGTAIDASGAFPDGTTFHGLAGLRSVLLDDPQRFAQTVTEKLATYALGRGVQYYDMPAVRQVLREAAPHDYTWSSLVLGIARSAPFQMRRTGGS